MSIEAQIKDAQDALVNAHNAGDEAAAQQIADHIVSLQSQRDVPAASDRTIGNVAGAAVGAIGGGALGRSLQSGIREEYPHLFKNAPVAPPTAPQSGVPNVTITGAPSSPKTGGENWVKSLTGTDIPDAQMSKKDLDLAKGMRETVGRGGPMAGGSITESGIMLGPKDTAAMAKEVAAAKEAAAAANKPTIMGRAKEVVKSANRNVGHALHGATNPWAIKTLGNVAAGAGAGMQAADAYQRFQDPNQGWIRGAVSGLGALGSGAAMTRVPALMLPGMAVGAAAPFVNEYLDKWAEEHPEMAKKLHMADGGSVKPDLLMRGIKAANTVGKFNKIVDKNIPHMRNGKAVVADYVADTLKGYLPHTPTKPHPLVGTRYEREAVGQAVPDIALDFEKKKGASVLPKPWDNLSANQRLLSVSGTPLTAPLTTHGGRGWVQEMANYMAGSGGASDPKIVNRINKRARTASEEAERAGGTGEVLHVPMTMDPVTGMNYSGFPALAIHDLMMQKEFNPQKLQQFNEMVRGNTKYGDVSDFVGFDDPRFKQQLLYGGYGLKRPAGDLRKSVADRMSLADPQKEIGYNIEDLVGGLADPKLVNTPRGYLGGTMIRANPDAPLVQTGNPIYPVGYGGEYIGSISDMPVEYMLPKTYGRIYQEMQQQYPNKHPNSLRAMAIGAIEKRNAGVSEVIDNQVLDNYGRFMEGIKSGAFDPNDLGSVQKFMETSKFAEGGEVQHMAEGKLTGGLSMLPKKQQEGMQKLEHGYNRFANQPAYQKAEMIGEALSDVPELAASFHPAYGLGYAGGALYDAVANTGDYGNAAMETVYNAPGVLKPIGAGIKAAAPMLRQAMPVVGGLGALGAADAAEAGQGSKLKQIIGGVMDQYAPKAKLPVTPGAPHTYGPQAEGPWMRDYQQAAPAQPQVPGERFDQHIWDQIREKHRNAQNATDYMMGRTGPNPRQPIQYMGKYRSMTPKDYSEAERREIETIKMLRKLREMD